MELQDIINTMHGRLRGGHNAYQKKVGIHQLSKEQHRFNAHKGGRRLAKLMLNEEYRKLHSMKIRYGRLKKRFNRRMFVEDWS
jgi:hypothetical protein